MTSKVADYVAKCICGTVKVKVTGPILSNNYCHCRACGRARSMTPVHLLLVQGAPEILQGAEHVKTIPGMGKMRHSSCTKCFTALYQGPEGASMFAAFPSTFHIEQEWSDSDDNEKGGCPKSILPPDKKDLLVIATMRIV